jgi:very-short-patch-repair endonuclease
MHLGASRELFRYAYQLRLRMTHAEAKLWEQLRNPELAGARFRRQHPLLYFIADFYCHAARIVVEVDGDIHLKPDQYQYDAGRTHELTEHGIEVMRFENELVMNQVSAVVSQIKRRVTSRLAAARRDGVPPLGG